MNLIVAFITGFTAGGLSCLAVQGGLLASSLAHQLELDLENQPKASGSSVKFKPRIAQPIFLFLVAKLIAYTLLGVLLGAFGSIFQLTPMMQAVLMAAIGIFMLGNGLRMLKVHPIFRYFIFEPPSALTRYIRRTSKNRPSLITTTFLGAMTVLIPCGVAQAMMAVALGTGNPVEGAAIMFAFTLGTSPVFFAVAYFTTRLGATLEKYFTRFVAATVIILGVIAIDSALNLAGSPVSFTRLLSAAGPAQVSASSTLLPTAGVSVINTLAPAAEAPANNSYTVNVVDSGYQPKVLHLAANRPISLNWVTKNVHSCALAVVVPGLNYQKVLPSSGQVSLQVPAQGKGTVLRYSCSMGMYTGQLVFDLD